MLKIIKVKFAIYILEILLNKNVKMFHYLCVIDKDMNEIYQSYLGQFY